jgi:hypothetical protein
VLTLGALVLAAAVAIIAVIDAPITASGGSDDDRPPIIVTNGSIIFYDGDPDDHFKHWLPWKGPEKQKESNTLRWRPNHPNGKTVNSFRVVITGVNNSDTTQWPTACNALISGDAMEVDFTPNGTDVKHFQLQRDHIAVFWPFVWKYDPVLDAPADLQETDGNDTTKPPALTFGTSGNGWITSVTVGSTTCTGIKQSDKPSVYIKPSPDDALSHISRKSGQKGSKSK